MELNIYNILRSANNQRERGALIDNVYEKQKQIKEDILYHKLYALKHEKNNGLFDILKELVEEYKLCIEEKDCKVKDEKTEISNKNNTWFKNMISSIINVIKRDGEVTYIMNNHLFDNILYLIQRSGKLPVEHTGENVFPTYDDDGSYSKKRKELVKKIRRDIFMRGEDSLKTKEARSKRVIESPRKLQQKKDREIDKKDIEINNLKEQIISLENQIDIMLRNSGVPPPPGSPPPGSPPRKRQKTSTTQKTSVEGTQMVVETGGAKLKIGDNKNSRKLRRRKHNTRKLKIGKKLKTTIKYRRKKNDTRRKKIKVNTI